MPEWFITYGVGMELIFAVVTLLVAIYAFKIYRLSSQKESELFGLGFLLISLSYITWFILNISALIKLNEGIVALQIDNALALINLGAYLHIFLSLLGLILLVYVNLRIKSIGTLLLLISLSIFPLIFSNNQAILFYFISSILISYLVMHYFYEYKKKKNTHMALMLSAFAFLFLGTFELIFTHEDRMHFVIGHIFILISYTMLLINLISVFKDGQKKK